MQIIGFSIRTYSVLTRFLIEIFVSLVVIVSLTFELKLLNLFGLNSVFGGDLVLA